MLQVGIIYKITYPNGKVYVGQDRTRDVNYFGSADSFTIAADFPTWMWDDFTITKTILEHVPDISIRDLNALEARWIKALRSNDPGVGYNRTGAKRRLCTTVVKETK